MTILEHLDRLSFENCQKREAEIRNRNAVVAMLEPVIAKHSRISYGESPGVLELKWDAYVVCHITFTGNGILVDSHHVNLDSLATRLAKELVDYIE